MGEVFDRSFLPPARCELVVLSDTHYLLRPELQGGEWESIRQFPERAERALRLAGALKAGAVVHLGDVTHEYPETGEAVRSRAGAQAQFAQVGLQPHVAPGNMDIGDKPDPTSPAQWVTPETLAAWDAAFGRSWHSFDVGGPGGIHGVVLNSPIMNGPLPEAEAQRRWFEADLAAHDGGRILLFLHHPLFFVEPGERAYGMYNSLDEPARGWLLSLIERHRVELVFAGHTHFVALNHLGGTRLFAAPSTTTSRAGLPEAFTVCPPDRGRSDLAKLGFYLVRDTERGASVHLIRTGAETPVLDPADPRRLVLTGTSRDLPASRVGIVATHPLGHMTPGPTIWPSVVRQRVRDDWRLLACLELGARHVRVPESDLEEATECPRLAVLRTEGVAITAFWLWSERLDLPAALAAHGALVDEVEVVFPGGPLPDPACLRQIAQVRATGKPVSLSTAIRVPPAPGQYHRRTRIGYRVDELAELDAWLGRHKCRVDRAVCRVLAADPPWEAMHQIRRLPRKHIGAVDLALDFPDEDAESGAALAAELIFAAAALPDSRAWLAPLVDMDRSMDVSAGLLDRLSNPRPAFHAARMLNAILFSSLPLPDAAAAIPPPLAACFSTVYEPQPSASIAGARPLALAGHGRRLWLFTNGVDPGGMASQDGAPPLTPTTIGPGVATHLTCYHLVEGTSEDVAPTASGRWQPLSRTPGPILLAT